VGPAQLFDSRRDLWSLMVSSWLSSVVLSGFTLARFYIDSNLHDTLRNG
jgi:hypothetical protein